MLLLYAYKERDIEIAKCKMKVCCIKKDYNTCADCPELHSCKVINEFYSKKGYKYKKYKQAIEYILNNNYDNFLKIAERWNSAYGKYTRLED